MDDTAHQPAPQNGGIPVEHGRICKAPEKEQETGPGVVAWMW
jgi:hypothetical protein